MVDEQPRDLVARFYAAAEAAALRREWSQVLELVDDLLVLDQHHVEALRLRTMAERHVDRAAIGAGRRHETVLFADLVGSTELTTRHDPEFVRRLIRSYELACTPVLAALGGHVHRFMGDGILASFGYPTAHEDDARRAVQAGLDLVRAVEQTSASHGDPGVALQVRVGIASGVLVHGDRGAGVSLQPGDLFGTPVNLAARIQAVAEPGEVCVSAETAALIEGFFELQPVGLVPLKGFDGLVSIQRVVRRTDARGWVDRYGEPIAAFVGRSGELQVLRERYEAACGPVAGGRGSSGTRSSVVLITGEPGIGKSRLSQEFVTVVAAQRPAVIELQCAWSRALTPLYPVRDAIERYTGIEVDDDDDVRRQKLEGARIPAGSLPYLALLLELELGESVPSPELLPAQLRDVTLGYLYEWIKSIAERVPLILFVEDLHWADPTTCSLLERMIDTPIDRVMLVFASRTVPDWLVGAEFVRLSLSPLSTEEAHLLTRQVAGDGLPDPLVDEIVTRSDGIPLFVEQLADSVKKYGGIRDAVLPENLTELLQTRLDAATSSKRIAQIAAVVGREFEPAVIDEVVRDLHEQGKFDVLDGSLEEHLAHLLERRLIESANDDSYRLRFHHALLCQAAYESQLTEEREERHDAVARVLLRGGASGRLADPAVVAYHFDRAHEPVEAITQYLAAATHAQSVGAVPEVMVHLHRADALLNQVVGPEHAPLELALRLCRAPATAALAGYGDPGSALDYEKSIYLCRDLKEIAGMETAVLQALLGVWCYYYATGDLAKSQLVTGAMEAQLEVATLPAGRPSFHACKGVELFCAGDLPGAERHFRAAIELIADDDVDPAQWPLPNDPLGAVYAFLSPLQLFWGDERGALVAAAAGVERCRHLEFPRGPFTVAFVRTYEAWMHRERGVPDAAIAAAQEVIELGDRHGFFDWVAAGRIQHLAATLAKSPSVGVLDELGDAIRAFRINGEEWILSSLLIDRGWGYLALGDLDQVESCLLETQEVLDHGQKTSLAEAHRLRAELVARRSGPDDPAVADELGAGMRFAIGQGAHLFVLRCGASYERWLGVGGLDADLRQAYEDAAARFGPTPSDRERFLRRCGPDASVHEAGVQPTAAG